MQQEIQILCLQFNDGRDSTGEHQEDVEPVETGGCQHGRSDRGGGAHAAPGADEGQVQHAERHALDTSPTDRRLLSLKFWTLRLSHHCWNGKIQFYT